MVSVLLPHLAADLSYSCSHDGNKRGYMHPPYCVFLLLLGCCLRVANFGEFPSTHFVNKGRKKGRGVAASAPSGSSSLAQGGPPRTSPRLLPSPQQHPQSARLAGWPLPQRRAWPLRSSKRLSRPSCDPGGQ